MSLYIYLDTTFLQNNKPISSYHTGEVEPKLS